MNASIEVVILRVAPGFSRHEALDFIACGKIEADVNAVRAYVEGLFGQYDTV